MALLSNRDLLRRVPIFASLTESQLSSLENSFVKQRFKSSSLIFRQGEQSNAFFVILVGRAHVITKDEQGREVIFVTLKQGDYFGEMSLIDGRPHSTSVKAVATCELLMIDRDVFKSCLPAPDSAEHLIMLSLVSRLRAADKKIESLALLNGKQRIFQFLKAHAVLDESGNKIFCRKISSSDIGRNIGASRELVTRMIKKLQDEGVIVKQSDDTYLIDDA